MLKKILIVHGPNLNLLGVREPHIYGSLTLHEINQKLTDFAQTQNLELKFFQSNSEGSLIDFIHAHYQWANAMIINPGAYTHYSYALRDAIAAVALPTIEVHLSDIDQREEFRKISVIAPVCLTQIKGLGWQSYLEALKVLIKKESVK